MSVKLKVKKLHPQAVLPAYQHPGDAGMDLFACEDVLLQAGEVRAVGTGIALAIPRGYVGLIWDKSGISLRAVHCLAGVVDSGYRGEVRIVLANMGREPFVIRQGMKIAQMLIQPVATGTIIETEVLGETSRGEGGFGSTGL